MRMFRKSLREIFTPGSFAKLTFVQRDKLNTNFERNFMITGKQLVVYGLSGSGKTTYIRNFLDSHKKNYIITNCIKGMKISDIVLDAFDKIGPYYIVQRKLSAKYAISSDLRSEYKGIAAAIGSTIENSEETTLNRVLPPQLTINKLITYLGKISATWIIDDFHKIEDTEKVVLSQIAKVFYDNATQFPDIRVVAIGAVQNATELLANDHELGNRIAEIEVPLLSDIEIEEILTKGFKLLNVVSAKKVNQEIVKIANNQASVAHQLAFDYCFTSKVLKTKLIKKYLPYGKFDESLKYSASQYSATFTVLLETLMKQRKRSYENVRVILWSMAELNELEMSYSQLYDEIKKIYPDYPSGNLTQYLKYLLSDEAGNIIRINESSDKYSIQNPIFRSFLKLYFRENKMIAEEKNYSDETQLISLRKQMMNIKLDDIYEDLKLNYISKYIKIIDNNE